MKNALAYVLVLAATFLLSGLVVIGTLMFRPDLLKGSATASAVTDTTSARGNATFLREVAGPTMEELTYQQRVTTDSLARLRDSVASLLTALDVERKKMADSLAHAKEAPPVSEAVAATVADTTKIKELKQKAKVLEAMPPENAAKVLANLTDDETIGLLKYVKARQAAKIIAAIQPERASKLFR